MMILRNMFSDWVGVYAQVGSFNAEYRVTSQMTLGSGRHVADGTLWAGVVTMLATLDISTAKDDQGRVIDFIPDFSRPGLTRCLVS